MVSSLLYFSYFLITSSIYVFSLSINGMYINRVFKTMPVALFKVSTISIDETGKFEPSFNKTLLEMNVKTYLSKSLKSKIDTYKISFSYLEKDNNERKITYEPYPTCVNVHFNCKYNKVFDYDGYMKYEIRRAN